MNSRLYFHSNAILQTLLRKFENSSVFQEYNILRQVYTDKVPLFEVENQEKEQFYLRVVPKTTSKMFVYLQKYGKIFSKLNHPNLTSFKNCQYDSSNNFYFYVTEKKSNITLEQKVFSLTLDEKWHIFSQIVKAFKYLHSVGYLYGQIIPKYIFLSKKESQWQVHLSSLHLYTIESSNFYFPPLYASGFLSPEQEVGSLLDRKSDIYTLGLFCQYLFGIKADSTTPEKPFSTWMIPILQKMLKKSPLQRYQDIEEVIHELLKTGHFSEYFQKSSYRSFPYWGASFLCSREEDREFLEQAYQQTMDDFLEQAYEETENISSHYPIYLIEGKNQIGKHHILQHFKNKMQAQGNKVIEGYAFPSEENHIGTFPNFFFELKLQTSYKEFMVQKLEDYDIRNLLWKELYQILKHQFDSNPLILLIDHLEEADELTLQFLEYLNCFQKMEFPMLIVGTIPLKVQKPFFQKWLDRFYERKNGKIHLSAEPSLGEGKEICLSHISPFLQDESKNKTILSKMKEGSVSNLKIVLKEHFQKKPFYLLEQADFYQKEELTKSILHIFNELPDQELLICQCLLIAGEPINFPLLHQWTKIPVKDLSQCLILLIEKGLIFFYRDELITIKRSLIPLVSTLLSLEKSSTLVQEYIQILEADSSEESALKLIFIAYKIKNKEKYLSYFEKSTAYAKTLGNYQLSSKIQLRALEFLGQDSYQRFSILRDLGQLWLNSFQYSKIIEHYPQILEEPFLAPRQKLLLLVRLVKAQMEARQILGAKENFAKAVELSKNVYAPDIKRKMERYYIQLKFEEGNVETTKILLNQFRESASSDLERFQMESRYVKMLISWGEYSEAKKKIKTLTSSLQKLASVELKVENQALLRQLEAKFSIQLAEILEKQGDFHKAYQNLDMASKLLLQYEDMNNYLKVLLQKSSLEMAQYQYSKSLQIATKAYNLSLLLDNSKYILKSRRILGQLQIEIGETKKGIQSILKALLMANETLHTVELCEMLFVMGKYHLSRKDLGRAEIIIRKAHHLALEKKFPYLSAQADFLLAQLSCLLQDDKLEKVLLERAKTTFLEIGNKKELCEIGLYELVKKKQKGESLDSPWIDQLRMDLEELSISHLSKLYQKTIKDSFIEEKSASTTESSSVIDISFMNDLEDASEKQEDLEEGKDFFELDLFAGVLDAPTPSSKAKKDLILQEEDNPSFSILLVDKEPEKCLSLQTGLSENFPQAKISSAFSSKDALKEIQEIAPDVLFMAVNMPDISGIEICRMLRGSLEMKETPIFLLIEGANFTGEIRQQAYRAGADDLLTKPVLMEEVCMKIERQVLPQIQRKTETRKIQETAFFGNLEMMALPELIQTIVTNNKTGCVFLIHEKQTGELYFLEGKIIHALQDNLEGEEAFFELLRWKKGHFEMQYKKPEIFPSITCDTMGLLMDGLRILDEEGN